MKHRIVWISLTIVFSLTATALLLFFSSQTQPVLASSLEANSSGLTGPETTIFARRIISIPFGIQDNLALTSDNQVEVVGHGNCTANGTTFRLWTTVTQRATKARGFLLGECQGSDSFDWTTPALTNPAKSFQAGEAEACGHVVVYTRRNGAIVKQWCKSVTLEATGP